MHRFTTEIKKDWRIVYPIAMLSKLVGDDEIKNHLKDGAWWTEDGGTEFNPETDSTFHCWVEENGELAVEGLGAMTNGIEGEKLLNSVEQMWDNYGSEENNPIFYHTLMA